MSASLTRQKTGTQGDRNWRGFEGSLEKLWWASQKKTLSTLLWRHKYVVGKLVVKQRYTQWRNSLKWSSRKLFSLLMLPMRSIVSTCKYSSTRINIMSTNKKKTFVKNCYQTAARLFAISGEELQSRKGTMQGDPLGMVIYAIAISSMLDILIAKTWDNHIKMSPTTLVLLERSHPSENGGPIFLIAGALYLPYSETKENNWHLVPDYTYQTSNKRIMAAAWQRLQSYC